MTGALREVIKSHPHLRRPFNNSSYPACGVNFGPRTVCFDHRDSSNAPGVPCSVTALGDYDPKMGGHLVIFDLKMIIEFPPGSTILLPSGSLRHGNTAVQSSETRTSFTQFCPGNLLRYESNGMCSLNAMLPAEKAEVQSRADEMWQEVMRRFSNIATLHNDRVLETE